MTTNRCEPYFKALEEPDDDPEFVLHPPAERPVFVVPPRRTKSLHWHNAIVHLSVLASFFFMGAWLVSPIVLFVLWWSK